MTVVEDYEHVQEGINGGGCYVLRKPVRFEELKNLWQHVLRRNMFRNGLVKKPLPLTDTVEAVASERQYDDEDKE
ncbi:type-b response regulator [Corchorus olitorius]|uniref:Type-b response regulator n=1 Tax=Corchorus olitorius TaxID=93759 RepID=A0A1R3IXI9_9ROSI|nr:type-b response regulator [Corchorus olitorius]